MGTLPFGYPDRFLPVLVPPLAGSPDRFLPVPVLLLPVLRVVWVCVPWEWVGWHMSLIRFQPETICPFADDFSRQRAELVRSIVLLGYPERSGPPKP